VEFVRRLRGTQPFAGAEALKAQLQQDIQHAQTIVGDLATCPPKT
jgi:FAD synthase